MILSEKQLVVACIIGASTGILVLLVLSLTIRPQNLPVSKASELSCSNAGSNAKVSIRGFVDSVSVQDSYALITVAGSETISAVSFDSSQIRKLGLKKMQEIEVTGQLRNYNGKPSLVISKLRLVNSSYGCGEESG